MIKGINHVAVAVENLEAQLPLYRDLFGFKLHAIEHVPDQKVRVAVLVNGPHRIELVEPVSDDSPISGFLQKRGPGLHHVCLETDAIAELLPRMKAAGIRLIDETPQPGADGCEIAFVHPKSTGGVLIELSQPAG